RVEDRLFEEALAHRFHPGKASAARSSMRRAAGATAGAKPRVGPFATSSANRVSDLNTKSIPLRSLGGMLASEIEYPELGEDGKLFLILALASSRERRVQALLNAANRWPTHMKEAG